ncbi:LPS export ABC transporter periplasmic protein LptC [candidate division KSB1 bacterium]|nr:LPS export ABC transporter periplasmic protein LptC [candidate division KSB1 bacterium]
MRKTVITILVLSTLFGCSRQIDDTSGNSRDEVPDQEGWNSVVTITQKGEKVAVVHYGHMAHYMQKNKIFFDQGVKVHFYNESGERASTLTSKKGELDEKNNNVKALEHVIVESDTGITLYTHELDYNQRKNQIVSNTDVMITTQAGDTLFGTGLRSDPQLHNYTIIQPHGRAHKGVDFEPENWPRSEQDSTINDELQ